MRIERFNIKDIEQAHALYETLGWTNYLKDEASFYRMFNQSLAVYAAFVEDKLVGIIRAIGDDAHILYIQDILVDPAYQRQGIGSKLMDTLLKAYPHVRQKVLITDAPDEKANHFYQALGFKKSDALKITAYLSFS